MNRTWKNAYRPDWKNGGDYCGSSEGITSLEGAPAHVAGFFDCSENDLTSLEGVPSFIGGNFYCQHTNITSLKNIHLQIRHIGDRAYLGGNPIKSHVLGLLLIDGLQEVMLYKPVDRILNRHLPSKGIESVLEAQDELILAGLEEFAQL